MAIARQQRLAEAAKRGILFKWPSLKNLWHLPQTFPPRRATPGASWSTACSKARHSNDSAAPLTTGSGSIRCRSVAPAQSRLRRVWEARHGKCWRASISRIPRSPTARRGRSWKTAPPDFRWCLREPLATTALACRPASKHWRAPWKISTSPARPLSLTCRLRLKLHLMRRWQKI
jgi:hypothetical protein